MVRVGRDLKDHLVPTPNTFSVLRIVIAVKIFFLVFIAYKNNFEGLWICKIYFPASSEKMIHL